MTNDLDPRRTLHHWTQYGALGLIAGGMFVFWLWWARVQVNRDTQDRVEKANLIKVLTKSTQMQAATFSEMSAAMKDLSESSKVNAASSKQNAESTERLNRELRWLRITGRRQQRTSDGE